MNLASVALCRHRDSKFHEWTASGGDHLPSVWLHCNKHCGWMLLVPSSSFVLRRCQPRWRFHTSVQVLEISKIIYVSSLS
jgi:hypothetical protein